MKKMVGWLRKKLCCRHYNIRSTYFDLHSGYGYGTEWVVYFRAQHVCKDCGWKTTTATAMPEEIGQAALTARHKALWDERGGA